MGKILACCLICLACFVGTGLAQTPKQSRFSNFLSGQEALPEELQTGTHIVYFGASWCVWCPTQKAILKTLEKSHSVTYCDSEKDVELYNYLRGTEGRIPLTVILIDGKIKKRYAGVHPAVRIQKGLKEACDKDCDKCKDAIY